MTGTVEATEQQAQRLAALERRVKAQWIAVAIASMVAVLGLLFPRIPWPRRFEEWKGQQVETVVFDVVRAQRLEIHPQGDRMRLALDTDMLLWNAKGETAAWLSEDGLTLGERSGSVSLRVRDRRASIRLTDASGEARLEASVGPVAVSGGTYPRVGLWLQGPDGKAQLTVLQGGAGPSLSLEGDQGGRRMELGVHGGEPAVRFFESGLERMALGLSAAGSRLRFVGADGSVRELPRTD